MATTETVEKDVTQTGKTVLSFHLPTPKWATYVFRTEFVINKAVAMYLAGTGAIPPEKVKEYLLILTIADFIVWFIARGLGFKKTDFEALTND